MVIEAQSFSKVYNTFAVGCLGKNIKTSESIKGIKNDSRLVWSPGHKHPFVLFVPTIIPIRNFDRKPTCSLDPGLRTFQTGYDKKKTFDIGNGISDIIKPIVKQINEKKCNLSWYKRLSKRLYDKIKHTVDDLHYKSAKWLCLRYDTILIGNISTKRCISKNGNLSPINRQLLQFCSHYKFRQRLIGKGKLFDCQVREVDESYTTRTCGNCGADNPEVGKKKIFRCLQDDCKFVYGRDYNAARNIMIKTLEKAI
jgi:transposase